MVSTKKTNAVSETEQIIPTMCSSHCANFCVLKVHVKDGVITRIETDDGPEPQLRACLRGRAYRQRVYDPGRILYPLKRVGNRGEAKFERIPWDEALDTIARQLIRVRDTYGPASIITAQSTGEYGCMTNFGTLEPLLHRLGGYTMCWGTPSFNGSLFASMFTYGTFETSHTRDDFLNSKLIILWGCNPAVSVNTANVSWFLARARESGSRIVVVDPRYTDSAVALADQWIPIRPGTDTAMLISMAYVMIKEKLQNEKFLSKYTVGFNTFMDYVLGVEDRIPKTPAWAENITGVSSSIIEKLAREYANTKPAALMAGISPGRTAYGEQYHRAAITLAAMTGNIGIHGGSPAGLYPAGPLISAPYLLPPYMAGPELYDISSNPVEEKYPGRPQGPMVEFFLGREPRVHYAKLADAILKGKAAGYPNDYKLLYVRKCNYLNQLPNSNKIAQAMKSQSLEFIVVEEQVMTATARFADIVLPANMFMEIEDVCYGDSLGYIGKKNKVIEPLGETKSPLQISKDLAKRLGFDNFLEKSVDEMLRERAQLNGIRDYDKFSERGIHWLGLAEPHVSFKSQIEDPENNPFPTPSGKIEIYSQQIADLGDPMIPPIPKYIEAWESRNDQLAKKYPLQLLTSHLKRRTNGQFETVPWLVELQEHSIMMNSEDARVRNIRNGDMVKVWNDRGEIIIRAHVTERITPGVADVPMGAWYQPDEKGIDRGGCANVLTRDDYSPGGAFPYNTGLVQVEKVQS